MARRLILLLQLPIPPLGHEPIRGNVPLAAGYLKLFARQQGLERDFEIEILPARAANGMGDQQLVAEIVGRRPWMVGFTCYLWNIDRTTWIAEQVKRRLPETRVLVGGPEITSDNDWVVGSPAIDFAVIGEGEQTFAALLSGLADSRNGSARIGDIPGLATRREPAGHSPLQIAGGGGLVAGPPRVPMADLNPISSPYLAGILDAGDQEQLLLETIRGCVFKCKFCFYPKAYDRLYYVSNERVLANLAHARHAGAREVYLLDPTLNQRRDFADFLRLLIEGNPDGQLEYYGELRAEGITPEHARLMRQANFKEVEIGLQSIDPATQELMDRRNNLKAFERGIRALQAEGVHVKIDLIVGLPGDTTESVRRGMHYVADKRLFDDIQVFQLSILPGTSFRQEAAALGLEYQPRPPYYVLRTPTLTLDAMLDLLVESEDIFDTTFDPLPPPSLDRTHDSHTSNRLLVNLDDPSTPAIQTLTAPTYSIWFRGSDLYAQRLRVQDTLRQYLAANPFSTLQVVFEAPGEFPFDVFDAARHGMERPENIYLDRFYEFTPGRPAGARRIVTVLPAECRASIDPQWLADVVSQCDLVWWSEGVEQKLATAGFPGEWYWGSSTMPDQFRN